MLEVELIGQRGRTVTGNVRNGDAAVACDAQDHIFNNVRQGAVPAKLLIFTGIRYVAAPSTHRLVLVTNGAL